MKLHDLVMPVAQRFWLVVLAVILVTAAAVCGLTRLNIQNDLVYMIPEDNRTKLQFMDAEEEYGDSVGIVLAINTPGGIYQGGFLRKVEQLSQDVLQLNTRLLAARLRRVVPLSGDQPVLLAAWVQGLVSDPTFSLDEFRETLADPDTAAEGLTDFAPPWLASRDLESLARETAQAVAKAVEGDPSRAVALVEAGRAPTDRRGKEKSRWVDRVVGLTQTNSAWPEFLNREEPLAVLTGWGIPADQAAEAFLDNALERGVNNPRDLAAMFDDPQGLARAGVAREMQDRLKAALNPERSGELLAALRRAPKQIRVAEMIDLGGEEGPDGRRLESLKTRLTSWKFLDQALYSRDGGSVLLLIRTVPNLAQEPREDLLAAVRELVNKDLGGMDCRVYQAGEAVVDHEIANYMTTDIARLLPLVVAVVGVFLFLSLRGLAGVVYPLTVALLSIVWCLGFMGFVGLPVSIVGTVLPVLLVAVGSAYGIHFIHHFQSEGGQGQSRAELARSAVNVTGLGVVIAGLTTVAGFGSLAANSIIALRDFGISLAVGVLFALVMSLFMVPAFLIKFGAGGGRKAGPEGGEGPQGSPGFFGRLSGFCLTRPWWVVLFFAAALAVSGAGVSRLLVEMNNMNFFQESSEIRQANAFINQNFAGTVGLRAVFDTGRENGALDPEVLAALEDLGHRITADNPEVGKVVSVVDLIKKMNQAFHYNDPAFYRLPRLEDLEGERTPRALLGQYAAYVDKFSRDDRKNFLDGKRKSAVLVIQVKTGSSTVSNRISNYILAELEGPRGETLRKAGVKVTITGIGELYKEASGLLVNGQMWSVALSMAIVLVLVAAVMRSAAYGLLSIVPLSITIILNFGLMGFLGIALDAGTAITACVAVGIGVDYSIHYLNRYRLCRGRGLSHAEAAAETARGSGKAILINAVSVAAGFMVLLFSSFVPLFNLGILISLTMLLTALGSLTLIPALLTIADRHKKKSPRPAAEGQAKEAVGS